MEEKPTAAFALSLIGGIFVLLGGIGIFTLFAADFGAIGRIFEYSGSSSPLEQL